MIQTRFCRQLSHSVSFLQNSVTRVNILWLQLLHSSLRTIKLHTFLLSRIILFIFFIIFVVFSQTSHHFIAPSFLIRLRRICCRGSHWVQHVVFFFYCSRRTRWYMGVLGISCLVPHTSSPFYLSHFLRRRTVCTSRGNGHDLLHCALSSQFLCLLFCLDSARYCFCCTHQ